MSLQLIHGYKNSSDLNRSKFNLTGVVADLKGVAAEKLLPLSDSLLSFDPPESVLSKALQSATLIPESSRYKSSKLSNAFKFGGAPVKMIPLSVSFFSLDFSGRVSSKVSHSRALIRDWAKLLIIGVSSTSPNSLKFLDLFICVQFFKIFKSIQNNFVQIVLADGSRI